MTMLGNCPLLFSPPPSSPPVSSLITTSLIPSISPSKFVLVKTSIFIVGLVIRYEGFLITLKFRARNSIQIRVTDAAPFGGSLNVRVIINAGVFGQQERRETRQRRYKSRRRGAEVFLHRNCVYARELPSPQSASPANRVHQSCMIKFGLCRKKFLLRLTTTSRGREQSMF